MSVPANIAEGYGRESARSYAHFLKVARGSLYEAETHMLLASRLAMTEPAIANDLIEKIDQISRMLNALIRSISKRGEQTGSN